MLTSLRHSQVGEWHRMDDGTGALLISDDLLPDDQSKQRLVATTVRIRAVLNEGLLPIADLVADGPRTWLVAASPAEPCLATLLADTTVEPDLSSARAMLHDTAAGLIALHRAELVHGGVTAQSVVVNAAGVSQLAEAGLVPALLGRVVTAEQDVQSWVALANIVVAQWGSSDGAGSRELLRLVNRASSEGLAPLITALTPDVAAGRNNLAAASHRLVNASKSDLLPDGNAAAAPTSDPAATAFGARRIRSGSSASGSAAPASATPGADQGVVRFGPGVAAAAPPTALAAVEYMRANSDAARRRQRRTTRRRWLTTIVIIAAVAGYLLWRNSWIVSVRRVDVGAHPQTVAACNTTVDFTGKVSVTGAGQLRYQWLRSDGTQSPVEHRNVLPGQRAVTAHLFWTFSGPGQYQAVARLKVWGSRSVTGQASATYSCR